MQLYKYYQTGERAAWKVLPYETGEDWQTKALDLGAVRISILSVTRPLDKFEGEESTVQYLGDFYFDVDVKPEDVDGSKEDALIMAHQSVADILNILKTKFKLPVKVPRIYLSGSKGYHIIIPKEAFGLSSPVRFLPMIYKYMAAEFMAPGVDFQVYSAGKGVSWRIPEVWRELPDGSSVKRTRISFKDFQNLTPVKYQELVTTPSTYQHSSAPEKSTPALVKFFERTKELVTGLESAQAVTALPDEDVAAIEAEQPPCVRALVTNPKLQVKNFNAAAMQVMVYLASTNQNSVNVANTIERFTESRTSSRFRSSMDAQRALRDIYASVKRGKKKFGCGYIKSTFYWSKSMCKTCAITERKRGSFGLSKTISMSERGTYLVDLDKDTKTLLFPGVHVIPAAEMRDSEGFVSGMALRLLTLGNRKVAKLILSAEDCVNAMNFTRSLRKQGVICTGEVAKNQMDVFAWFQTEVRANQEVESMVDAVSELGLSVTAKGRCYWVTPESSYETNGMQDTVHLDLPQAEMYREALPVDLANPKRFSAEEKMRLGDAILKTLDIRHKTVTGTLLGWSMACWLNPFLKTQRYLPPEFPVLRVTGTTGVGKSSLLHVFVRLTGLVDRISLLFGGGPGGSSLVGGTHAMGSSKLFPIIWEEVNATGDQSYNNRLRDFLEAVKNAWNGDKIVKARSANRTELSLRSMTNPTILSGEIEATTESLSHRSIWLHLGPIDTPETERFRHAYAELTEYDARNGNLPLIESLSDMRSFMFYFLGKKSEKERTAYILGGRKDAMDYVAQVVKENDLKVDARKMIAISVVLQGLDLMVDVMLEYELLQLEQLSVVADLRENVVRYQLGLAVTGEDVVVSRELTGRTRLSDGHLVLQTLVLMAVEDMKQANLSSDSHFTPIITGEGGMFRQAGGFVVINMTTAFGALRQMRSKDSLNFGLASLADFRMRLTALRHVNSSNYEESPNECAIKLSALPAEMIDHREFKSVSSKYMRKRIAYDPSLLADAQKQADRATLDQEYSEYD